MYYVIMRGDYSDKHIVGVTCNQEKAQKIKECYSDSWREARIEEWDESDVNFNNFYEVRYNKVDEDYMVEKQSPDEVFNLNVICEYNSKDGFVVSVQAEKEDLALKIARDLYAEYKAKNEGII